MNVRHVLVIISILLALGTIWFTMTEPEPPTFLKETQALPATTSPGNLSKPSDSDNAPPAVLPFHSALTKQTEVETASISAKPQENSLPAEQTETLMEQTLQELRLEEGLSAFNLMLLKDLAMRLNEDQSKDPKPLIATNTEWPDELIEALQRLSAALQAETAFQEAWQQQASQDPQTFREAFLSEQQQILGTELFQKIHSEDAITIDDAGLSAHFKSKEDNPELQSEAHQKKLKLLQQWHLNQLSEAELTRELAQSLSADEINQLIETGTHEAKWLTQIEAFLDEYRYIEQAGIIGEDERQMRRELIEKHFQQENREIANQFLFSTQSTNP